MVKHGKNYRLRRHLPDILKGGMLPFGGITDTMKILDRTWGRRALSILLVAVMAFSLTACSKGEEPEESSEVSVQATPTPTPKPTPEPPKVPADGLAVVTEKTNRITGEDTLTKEAYGKRSVSVMINNALDCLPQYGIGAADLIYEIPVEGDVTRLMCVFGDYTKIPDLCSIRSCRYYYPLLAAGMDSVYIHWGLDKTVAADTLYSLGIDNIDGNNGTYGLFDRDQDRINSGYNLEHTSRLHGPDIPKAFADNDVRLELGEDYQDTVFKFNYEDVVPAGTDCKSCELDFSSEYYSTFEYDESSKTYLKGFSGNDHIDSADDSQLEFTNLIVLETSIGVMDDVGRRSVDLDADNYTGYYISKGKMQNITWSKDGDFSPVRIYDEKGEELPINKGKTYIAICNSGTFSVNE